ncbi:phosphate acyltransferase [Tepidanaerobacter acetatoxydans]|uniref:phosphate acyltransferase n=1 Tax=Tepidanaerobacter acetatoxydans TaxID=499229 RepID=UPI001BD36264|nr:phosphate acyltransferase [Tepidanaerobacter acetatoxydans]
MYKNFEELLVKIKAKQERKRVAVVWANEDHTLEAVLKAYKEGIIDPILIGDGQDISYRLEKLGCSNSFNIITVKTPLDAIDVAIKLVKENKADIILKGLIETADIMKAIVKKENALCERGVMSHLSLVEIPNYYKLIGITDCALLMYPTLEQKKLAICNAVEFLTSTGFKDIKVAVLAAVEKVNPKMPETVDANQLKVMCQEGEIPGCQVEGPISYDLAMKPGAAAIKGFDSAVAGNPDLLVVPNIVAGNILVKCLTCSAKARSAGLILGAKVPIIITSRSSSVQNKYLSIVIASAIGLNLPG